MPGPAKAVLSLQGTSSRKALSAAPLPAAQLQAAGGQQMRSPNRSAVLRHIVVIPIPGGAALSAMLPGEEETTARDTTKREISKGIALKTW